MELGKVIKRGEDLFSFFFFFFFFFCASHSWKRRKFVLVHQNRNFLPKKKIKKMTLPPQKNLPVTPCSHVLMFPACLHAGTHFPSFGWGWTRWAKCVAQELKTMSPTWVLKEQLFLNSVTDTLTRTPCVLYPTKFVKILWSLYSFIQ